jgi:cobyrinic acid a,c-diamide synthase
VHIRCLVWEVYNISERYVLCGLCEQEEREQIVRYLETLAARALEQKLNLQDQLVTCREEEDILQQDLKTLMAEVQVSHSDFSPIEDRIFCFHCTFLRERKLLCYAF